VLGTIHGNVETTDKIDIRKGRPNSSATSRPPAIVIEDGAYFKGNIDIVRAETPRRPRRNPSLRRRHGSRRHLFPQAPQPLRAVPCWPPEPRGQEVNGIRRGSVLETRNSNGLDQFCSASKSAPAWRFWIWQEPTKARSASSPTTAPPVLDDFLLQTGPLLRSGRTFTKTQTNPARDRNVSPLALDFPMRPSMAPWSGTSWSIFLRACWRWWWSGCAAMLEARLQACSPSFITRSAPKPCRPTHSAFTVTAPSNWLPADGVSRRNSSTIAASKSCSRIFSP